MEVGGTGKESVAKSVWKVVEKQKPRRGEQQTKLYQRAEGLQTNASEKLKIIVSNQETFPKLRTLNEDAYLGRGEKRSKNRNENQLGRKEERIGEEGGEI